MVTRKDVAKLARVSETTVSRVLKRAPYARVSPRTRKRILQAAAQLNYRPHHAASTLVTGKTKQIAVVFYHSSYFTHEMISPNFLAGAVMHAARRGFRITVATTTEAPEAPELHFLNVVRARAVDGVVVHDEAMPEEYFFEMVERRMPFASIKRAPEGLESNIVAVDHGPGFAQMAEAVAVAGYDWLCSICNPARHEKEMRTLFEACEAAGIRLAIWDLQEVPLEDESASHRELERFFAECGPRGAIYTAYPHTVTMREAARRAQIPVPDRLGFLCDAASQLCFNESLPGGILLRGEILAEKAVQKLCWLMGGRVGEIDDSPVVTGFTPGALLRKPDREDLSSEALAKEQGR